MIANFVDIDYLKTFVPEIDRYIWSDQASILTYKPAVEEKVLNDFTNRGYKFSDLKPSLYLRTSSSATTGDETNAGVFEEFNRRRLVYTYETGGSTSIILQGSTDNATYTDITTITLDDATTDPVTSSTVFVAGYNYYRLKSTGSGLTYTAYLTETVYDLLFAYYWIYLVLLNAGKGQENEYTQYANVFLQLYMDEWAKVALLLNDNGVTEQVTSSVRMGR